MNSYFDLNRWLLYISKQWNENKRRYLLSLGALAGLLVLWFSFIMLVNKWHPLHDRMQLVSYYVGLYLTGCLYASLIFSDLSDGPKGISYLLLPASLLEKLLTALLFGVILYLLCYTAVFYIVDFTMVKVSNALISSMAAQEHQGPFPPQEVANVFVAKDFAGGDEFIFFLLGYFAILSIFLLGSVYFVKYNYIKTLIWGLIVFLVLVFFQHKIIESFMPPGNFFKPFTVYRVYDGDKGELGVRVPEWISSILMILLKYCLPPALWVVTYFRLKEKEV
jgi:hypothetical protein